ncbi:MAG: hypothetical protein EA391_05075 [Balneolaceae bacterium]|nr:MAG: hypothetical protein EA391_05075 [Balneolaceae bacterium]
MIYPRLLTLFTALLLIGSFTACSSEDENDLLIFTNATIWNGTNQNMQENAALVTRDGRVVSILDMNDPDFPEHAQTVDLGGAFVVPGLINAHGHIGMADGLDTSAQAHTTDNVVRQLKLSAAYGVTTVVSLGDEPYHAFLVRDNIDPVERGMARVFLAGDVLSADTPDEAAEEVERNSRYNPDWMKIRVDDGLGRREKMSPDVYSAIIDEVHNRNLKLAAHIVYLEDAKGIVQSGGDLIAHSVRDEPVDSELIDLMLDRDVCITPTLTRELSVYVYSERPDFFDDPFFLEYADPEVLEQLQRSEVQEVFTGNAADYFRDALPLAKENMVALNNAGVRVAMGTDSGPPARFQGYFEHLEMQMMQDAGMTPAEILQSSTRYAAECMGIDEELGTLEAGKWADFVVVEDNPFDDISNLRSILDVYIGARRVQR